MKYRILLSGGGTLGPVTPLLAVAETAKLQNLNYQFSWIGTKNGPEQYLVKSAGIPYFYLISGKWRRYFSWQNLFAPLFVIFGFLQALFFLIRLRPHLILSAGGFVSVPLAYAGWLARIPVVVHEQDVLDGLANKLMRPIVTFRTSVWSKPGAVTIGNLIRPSIYGGHKGNLYSKYGLSKDMPVILVTGGGTGALSLNKIIIEELPEINKYASVVHITGKGKQVVSQKSNLYYSTELVAEDLADLYSLADVVITRAGMGTLSELAALKKSIIVIPIPDSHQEKNADLLRKNEVAIVIDQKNLTSGILNESIKKILSIKNESEAMGLRLHNFILDGTEIFLEKIQQLLVSRYE